MEVGHASRTTLEESSCLVWVHGIVMLCHMMLIRIAKEHPEAVTAEGTAAAVATALAKTLDDKAKKNDIKQKQEVDWEHG